MCYWELMWTYSYQQDWVQAFRYADLLCKESRWSKVSRMLDGSSGEDESWTTRTVLTATFARVCRQSMCTRRLPSSA